MRPYPSATRREFLLQASAAAAGASLASKVSWGHGAETKRADPFIAGKDHRLIVHNAIVGEIETPLALLREKTVTPKELLFVRNNQVLDGTLTTEPADLDGWKIDFGGLLDASKSVEAAEINRLPQEKVEIVLQCSGNGRERFSKTAKAEGAPWQNGAMGNLLFQGVRLKAVLDHFGLKPKQDANYITAEGKDAPDMAGGADFEHSLPMKDALARSLIAFSMNGEPLPKVHGGPVRLITPGYYATMNVKWLSRLRFEGQESSNRHHAVRYRTPREPISPGAKFTATLENSDPNWNMRIKSVIFSPLEGEKLPAGRLAVSGVAWNDGACKMESVEISADGGKTWRSADLKKTNSPFAWQPWVQILELGPGEHTIISRAIDALGRAQPLDGSITWNPAGYAWNGADSVKVAITAG